MADQPLGHHYRRSDEIFNRLQSRRWLQLRVGLNARTTSLPPSPSSPLLPPPSPPPSHSDNSTLKFHSTDHKIETRTPPSPLLPQISYSVATVGRSLWAPPFYSWRRRPPSEANAIDADRVFRCRAVTETRLKNNWPCRCGWGSPRSMGLWSQTETQLVLSRHFIIKHDARASLNILRHSQRTNHLLFVSRRLYAAGLNGPLLFKFNCITLISVSTPSPMSKCLCQAACMLMCVCFFISASALILSNCACV